MGAKNPRCRLFQSVFNLAGHCCHHDDVRISVNVPPLRKDLLLKAVCLYVKHGRGIEGEVGVSAVSFIV